MKNMFRFSALLCAMAVLVTSCTKDETLEPQRKPIAAGDEIIFGSRAGFENGNPDSRTVYSGETYEVKNSDGTKTKFERIDWVNDTDLVQIYYDKGAKDNNTVSYKIKGSEPDANGETFSYLQKMSANGLQWGSDEGDEDKHTFYAMYPAPEMIKESTLAQGIKMTGTTLNGYVPQAQNPVSVKEDANGNYVAAPDMTYAYMAAKEIVDEPKESVSLTFVPIVTAVEIELEVPAKVEGGTGDVVSVQIAEIKVEGSGIAGAFTADLKNWDKSNSPYPTCTNSVNTGTVTTNAIDLIQIPVWQDSKPITLAAGKSLTFTVFLRPGTEYKDLKVSISPNGAGYVGKSIPVTIAQHKKTIISNVKLPAVAVKIDASKWMSQLDSNTKIQKLSLPGTGGTFSYAYSGSDSQFYKQQTLTFNQQWAAGIRAFEIVCDRPNSGTLANQNVDCNKESVGTKVGTVLTDLLTKTATIKDSEGNPSECAVLILTYQPHGASPSRNASSFASSLKTMYDNLTPDQKAQIIKYTPDLTIGQAAGKVMIFARVNQFDEKDGGNFSTASTNIQGTNITLIDGCGTGKDRWGARGYLIKGKRAADISNSASDYLENYMTTNDYQLGAGATKGEADFSFDTNSTDTKVWYQEWARVIPQNTYKAAGRWNWSSYPAIYWFESYNEKLQNAKDTFHLAINSQATDKTIYINSLCGYLAGTDFTNSLVPSVGSAYGGDGGNIKALADKLNPAFYQYVLKSGMEQATGPTGIVLMDYVTNAPTEGVEYDGSYLLPGVIIANNFKFTANNNQSGSGNGNNDQQQPGGGNGDGDGTGTEG